MTETTYEKKIGFLLGERYRLELHWTDVQYKVEGRCDLIGAYFSGPALQFAEKVEPNNQILLDFYKQYFIFAKDVYIATLLWKDVTYKGDNIILLGDTCIVHDTELNRVPKLVKDDYLVIDLKGHDSAEHAYNPTYNTIVVNNEGVAYNFWHHHGSYRKAGSN